MLYDSIETGRSAYQHKASGGTTMTSHDCKGKDALRALMTLCGQNAHDHEARTRLLARKGIITGKELGDSMRRMYDRGISPAERARRSMNPEDNDALNIFFECCSSLV